MRGCFPLLPFLIFTQIFTRDVIIFINSLQEKVLKEKEDYLKQYENVERKLHRLNGNHSKKMAESEKEIQRLKVLFH